MLEECEDGVATATGMAAVFASLAGILQSGDHLIASRALFGSAHQIITQILSKWGITHTYLDASAPEADWEAAIQPNTRMVYVETPSNPGLELVDMAMIGKLCEKHGFQRGQLLRNALAAGTRPVRCPPGGAFSYEIYGRTRPGIGWCGGREQRIYQTVALFLPSNRAVHVAFYCLGTVQ